MCLALNANESPRTCYIYIYANEPPSMCYMQIYANESPSTCYMQIYANKSSNIAEKEGYNKHIKLPMDTSDDPKTQLT